LGLLFQGRCDIILKIIYVYERIDNMSIKKTKRIIIVLVIIIITFIGYSAIVFKTINPIHSFAIWKSVAVDGNDFYEIQEGTYAGGDPDISTEGYVFVTYQYSAVEAMDKIGFHDLGHTYFDGKNRQPEYCTSEGGDHAIIEGRLLYLGGYLLKYRVVGEA
jgi:hypothetical protein